MKINKAVAGLAGWVIAIEAYHRTSKMIRAKQAQLVIAESKLKEARDGHLV